MELFKIDEEGGQAADMLARKDRSHRVNELDDLLGLDAKCSLAM